MLCQEKVGIVLDISMFIVNILDALRSCARHTHSFQ